jgi:hypothetical protein
MVEGRPLYAHKNILFARSDVLTALVTNGMKESSQGHVTISDMKYDVFRALLEFL